MWSSTSKNYVILFVCSSLFCVSRSLSDGITQEITRNADHRRLNELSRNNSSPLQRNFFGFLKADGSLDIDFIANIADGIDVDDNLSDGQNRSEEGKETAPAPTYSFEYCPTRMTDYIPCLDNVAAISLLPSTDKGEKWERHCPKDNISCLIPPPKDYKSPIRWPKSKDEVWYSNVPHTRLVADKGGQNWIAIKGTKFIFPGGGTQFAHGADQYLDQISQMIPDLAFGVRTHVALDIGCGVASFGAYLLSRNVTTLSVAPKDVHENQIQFALERGVPAMVTVLATRRLVFPSQAFDLIHCSRCRINWTRDDGILLAEVDRVLRAGGYFAWAAQPVYKHEESSMHAWNDMLATASRLCWELVAKEGYIAIWQKPTNNTCYFGSQSSEILPLCDEDPNSVWYCASFLAPKFVVYVPLKACISVTSKSMANIPSWPTRLLLPPQRLQEVNLDSLDAKNEIFIADTRYWYAIVEGYLRGLGLKKEDVRNVMDMNAGLGGFSAALISQNVDWWVMNVVPTSALNTLPVIYDRGLVGVIHDWCEAFDTYPRTYDLLHSVGLFAQEERRCNMVQIMLEMDRILRPGGWVLIREEKSIAEKLEQLAKALKWKTRILETESGAFGKDKLLSCQKTL